MGRWTIRDLVESDGVEEVCAADLDGRRARETAGWAAARAGSSGTARVQGMQLDAGDPDALRRALERVDVACNCAPHATNLAVMAACADTGTHYLDLGGLFHTTRKQLELGPRFAAAGVTAVCGMGASPGTTNVMAALAARGLARVDAVEVRLGVADFGPSTAPLPLPYAAGTLLDEVTEPAMAFRDGAFVALPAMSEPEELRFPDPVGTVRVGHVLHSEVATLPLHFAAAGVREVSFKLGFPSAFMDRLTLLARLGLAGREAVELDGVKVVPRELLVRLLDAAREPPEAQAAPDDAEAIWVRVRGRRAARPGRKAQPVGDGAARPGRDGAAQAGVPVEVLAECVVRAHPGWQAGAGQLDTGVPPSVVAQLLARRLIDRPGVFAPEQVVPPEPYFAELARRRMEVSLVTRERVGRSPRGAAE
jgi:saccharopine dehydrogenase (NAD+, L-lysine-forming)